MNESPKDRLAELRKELDISQEELGQKIGVSRFSVSNYESGKRNLTDRVMKDICREFNASYLWLTEGIGDMFLSNETDTTAMFDRIMAGSNETAKALFKALSKLGDDEWQVIYKVICDVAESLGQKK